jgi:hypothetical protein
VNTFTAFDSGGRTCHVFAPGHYTQALDLVPASGGSNYLQSGVYFLDLDAAAESTFETTLGDATVVGGIPAPGEAALTTAVAQAAADLCPMEDAAATGNHFGVVIVLGRAARLVADASTVELFSYLDPGQLQSPGVSVLQLLDSDGWGPGLASSVVGAAEAIVETASGTAAALAIHGNVYVPAARVSAFGNGGSGRPVVFDGGVVAAGRADQAVAIHQWRFGVVPAA